MCTTIGNPTHKLATSSRENKFYKKHKSVMVSFGISLSDEDLILSKLYWIPKLHNIPYKRHIAGSAKCSTIPSHILTRRLTAVKQGLQKYFNTAYARSGVSQMWS